MKYVFTLLLLATITSHAGTFKTTCHSRANCANVNESITWNGLEEHWWRVYSVHATAKRGAHNENTFMKFGHRCAVVHISDFMNLYDPWTVQGYHFYMDVNGYEIYDCYTVATGCNLGQGWL